MLFCGVLICVFLGYVLKRYLSEQFDNYYTIFDTDVNGLFVDAKVKLNGISVGSVTSITINEQNLNQVVVAFKVQRDSEYVTFTVDIDGRLSSAAGLSSSSQTVKSSSSEHTTPIAYKTPAQKVRVRAHNGDIYIHAPQQGEKTVRIFSPIGTLLFEKKMDGTELVIEKVQELRNANVILSVTQGNKQIYTGMLHETIN